MRACTLDDIDGALSRDTLNHYFPGALDVLARVVEARRASGQPPAPGLTATAIHVQRMMGVSARLNRQLRATAGEQRTTPVALLLIESMLWVRLPSLPSTAPPDLHAAGPVDGDLVVVTSEDVVRQVAAGETTLADARSRGLVRLYGTQAAIDGFMLAVGRAGATPAPPPSLARGLTR